MPPKNTICLWYESTAVDAANFYAETFPASKQGDVLTVEFTVADIPCLGLNGDPQFKHSEAFSFQTMRPTRFPSRIAPSM